MHQPARDGRSPAYPLVSRRCSGLVEQNGPLTIGGISIVPDDRSTDARRAATAAGGEPGVNVERKVPERVARLGPRALAVALVASALLSVATSSPFPVLFAVLAALFAYPWYRSLASGRLELFEPIVLHSIFFGMVVIALFDRAYLAPRGFKYPIVARSHVEAFTLLCLVYAAVFASTLAGYYWLGPKLTARETGADGDFDRTRTQRAGPTDGVARAEGSDVIDRLRSTVVRAERASGTAFRLVAIAYVLIGLLSLAAIVLVVFPEPDPLYVFQGSTPRSELFAGNNVLVMGTRGLYVGYLFWLAGALADRRTPSLVELFAALPIVGLMLLTGGRTRSFQVLLMLAIVVYYVVIEDSLSITRGIVARIAGRAPPLVVFVLLPILGAICAVGILALRGLRQGESVAQAVAGIDPIQVATAGIQNDRLENFLALTEVVPEEFGYYYGSFYLRVPMNLIPGRFWEAKPPLTVGGELRRQILPQQAGGRQTGAIGDYYANFGYPGMVILGLCYGAALFGLSRLVAGDRVSALRLVCYAIFLSIVVRTGLTNGALFSAQIHAILLVPGVLGLALLTGHDRPWELGQRAERPGEDAPLEE